MGVRFVHAADLHLGSPLQAVGVQSSDLRTQLRDATYTALERIVDLCLEEGVDFLVLAGDLYDQKNRSVRANEFISDQLSRLDDAGIPAYVIYGNHDPLGEATDYVSLPDNVYEFGHQEAECAVYPNPDDPQARIWGQSYRTEREGRKIHESYSPTDASIPNIGVLHTGLSPDDDSYVPCSAADLKANDAIHYWALGHIHQPRLVSADPPIVYPGIPQGRHVEESGPGGCVLVDLETDGDVDMEYVPVNSIVWQAPDVPVAPDDMADDADDEDDADNPAEPVETLDGVQRRIETRADTLEVDILGFQEELSIPVRADGWSPEGFVCRWHLRGRGHIHEVFEADPKSLRVLEEQLREALVHHAPFVWTESVVDRTGPPIPDIDELRGEDPLVDEFLALMSDFTATESGREELRAQTDYNKTGDTLSGNVWEVVDDPEEASDDRLALTDEKLDELTDRAEQHVLDALATRRVE